MQNSTNFGAIFFSIIYSGLCLVSSYILPMYSDKIQTESSCTPAKNVTATIMDVQPASKLFQLKTYDNKAYINIIKDINIDIIPTPPNNLSGFVENPIIPSVANFNIFFNGYFVFPANLSFLSYLKAYCLYPTQQSS